MLQGFDANDNPAYSYATSTLFPNPGGINDVKRIEYDNQSGALYVTGRTSSSVNDNWGCAGDVLAKYSNYLTNSNAMSAWAVTIPFFEEGTTAADENIKAFCTAGDYIFTILTKFGKIVVREKETGNIVGEILPNASTDFTSGWSDINGAIQAHKRANGEYLIFAEENGNGKIMMYRWCPTGNCASLSLNAITNKEKTYIHPNPTNNFVFIDLKELQTLELYNIYGQCVYSKQNASDNEKIEMQNLSSGIYLLKTKTGVYKIVKN